MSRRRTIALVALAAGCGGGATTTATQVTQSQKEDPAVHTDPRTTIDVAVGEAFTVRLPVNPSTGYRWEASVPMAYTQISDEILKPAGGTTMVGAPSAEQWVFSADAAGTATIGFSLFAPGASAPEKTVTFTVAAR